MAASRRTVARVLSQSVCRQCQSRLSQPNLIRNARVAPVRAVLQSSLPKPTYVSRRWHSAPSSYSKVYEFEQIREMTESPSPDRILIDVREPAEVNEGYIPTAINIPIKSQPDALMLPEEEFEDRFGFSKPETDKEVVFYCRSGVRSSAAASFAQQNGYKNVAEYRGSWLDWQEKGGQASKP